MIDTKYNLKKFDIGVDIIIVCCNVKVVIKSMTTDEYSIIDNAVLYPKT